MGTGTRKGSTGGSITADGRNPAPSWNPKRPKFQELRSSGSLGGAEVIKSCSICSMNTESPSYKGCSARCMCECLTEDPATFLGFSLAVAGAFLGIE